VSFTGDCWQAASIRARLTTSAAMWTDGFPMEFPRSRMLEGGGPAPPARAPCSPASASLISSHQAVHPQGVGFDFGQQLPQGEARGQVQLGIERQHPEVIPVPSMTL